MKHRLKPANSTDRIARWIGFLALAALLAMATLPVTSHQRGVAAADTNVEAGSWHG